MEVRTAGSCLFRSFTRQNTLRHASRQSPIALTRTAALQPTRLSSSSPLRLEEKSTTTDSAPSTKPAPSATNYSSLIDSALDFTKSSPNTSQGRTSHHESRNLPASRKSSPSSIDDIISGFAPRNRTAPNRGGFSMENMLDPASRTGNPRSSAPAQLVMPEPLPAYGPSVGRTVTVDPGRGMDVGRAFRSLEINCSRNKVRADFNRQRFHERGGLKRKRLRSERWRRRFREGFRGVVKMVSAMKKQGW